MATKRSSGRAASVPGLIAQKGCTNATSLDCLFSSLRRSQACPGSSLVKMMQILKDETKCWAAALVLAVFVVPTFSAIPSAAAEPSGELDVVRVRPNFYMLSGAGGNIAVQIGSDGVVLVGA